MTQKCVMELTGINSKSLSGYENNVAEPDLKTLADLANLYEISVDYALEISSSGNSCILSKSDKRLLRLYHSMDNDHQKKLLIVLESLLKSSNACHNLYGRHLNDLTNISAFYRISYTLRSRNPPASCSFSCASQSTFSGSCLQARPRILTRFSPAFISK